MQLLFVIYICESLVMLQIDACSMIMNLMNYGELVLLTIIDELLGITSCLQLQICVVTPDTVGIILQLSQ